MGRRQLQDCSPGCLLEPEDEDFPVSSRLLSVFWNHAPESYLLVPVFRLPLGTKKLDFSVWFQYSDNPLELNARYQSSGSIFLLSYWNQMAKLENSVPISAETSGTKVLSFRIQFHPLSDEGEQLL